MNAVEKHPQRQQIIDGILSGASARSIAASLVPPVHHTSITRFRLKMLAAPVAKLRGVTEKSRAIKEIAMASGIAEDPHQALDDSKERLRQELQTAIVRDRERMERWISSAECAQTINPLTGEAHHEMDHAALARHSRNALSATELRAKLAGLMSDTNSASGTNNQIVMVPQVHLHFDGSSQAEPGNVVDVTAIEQ